MSHATIALLKHFVWWDEPSATSRSLQKAVCGAYVQPRAVVFQREEITCTECERLVKAFDALEGP
jgi:hypothetical protein